MAVRGKAKELYTVEGLTFDEVAEALTEIFPQPTPSLSQIKRWAKDEGWRGRKGELRRGLRELEEGSLEFKRLLMNKALEILKSLEEGNKELDPQKMFGLVRVAKVISPKETGPREEAKEPEIDRPALFLKDLNFIAKVLKEVNPEGLKILALHFDLIVSRFKASHAQAA